VIPESEEEEPKLLPGHPPKIWGAVHGSHGFFPPVGLRSEAPCRIERFSLDESFFALGGWTFKSDITGPLSFRGFNS
jgi:hypothetical protein